MVFGPRMLPGEYEEGHLSLLDSLAPLAAQADGIIKAEVKWAAEQFKLIGRKDAADLAVQLVATLQGISLLANAMKSPGLLGRQVSRLREWVDEM